MAIIKLKTKGQMTLPNTIRKQAGLRVGDFLKISIERNKITLTPQSVLDRELAESLEDVKQGRVHGPFNTAEEAIAFLHGKPKRKQKKITRK